MDALLKLQTGIHSLNEKEFMTMMNSFDKNYLTNLLFKYFHFELNNAKSLSNINNQIVPEIQSMNNKISKIIISRQTKINKSHHDNIHISVQNDDEEYEPLQLDELPSVMISSISSFLGFHDVLNFEKCNKSIFIGTRSPISLYRLSSSYSSKLIESVQKTGNIFHWNRFKSIKKVSMEIDDEEEHKWLHVISDLSSLEFFDIPWISKDITLPNGLKGIAVENIENDVYFPENIESVHLYDFSSLSNKFNNLKEICVAEPNQKEIDLLNKQNLDNLERVHLHSLDVENLNMESLQLLLSHSCINYISINAHYIIYMLQFINVLNKALKGISRKTMKIQLQCDGQSDFVDELKREILELIDILKNQTNDFMVIGAFRIKQENEIDFDDSIKSDLLIQSKFDDTDDIEDKIWKFVIKNKKCQMNQYKEKWLMECSKCKQMHY